MQYSKNVFFGLLTSDKKTNTSIYTKKTHKKFVLKSNILKDMQWIYGLFCFNIFCKVMDTDRIENNFKFNLIC